MTAPFASTLPSVTDQTADDAQKAVLAKALAQVGFIPNMYARMVNVPGLLDMYLDGYASFRAASGFTAPEQEVVFLTISRENGCDYCVAAHSFIADAKSKVPVPVTDAIRNRTPIPDSRLAALSAFTQEMVALTATWKLPGRCCTMPPCWIFRRIGSSAPATWSPIAPIPRRRLSDVLSPTMILAFAGLGLLALLPVAIRKWRSR